MSSLAVVTAARMGAARIVVANRSATRAQRLAATVSAATADLARLPAEIAAADLVVSCTGAPGHVITVGAVAEAQQTRTPARPLVLLDLALPRDVDPAAGQLDGVTVIGLDAVGDEAESRTACPGPRRTSRTWPRSGRSSPRNWPRRCPRTGRPGWPRPWSRCGPRPPRWWTRSWPGSTGRVDDLDARARREIAQSMRRIADKLLHAPTVRVKELAGSPGGDSYEAVLRVLFDLDPDAVQAVTRAEVVTPEWLDQEAPK